MKHMIFVSLFFIGCVSGMAVAPVIPAHITDISQIKDLYSVDMRTLNLSHQNIVEIDGVVFEQISANEQLQNLRVLNLFDTQLAALSPKIDQLQNLVELNLGRTQINALPPEIGRLKNLMYLYLYNTQITALPREIGQLQNLKDLHLNNTPIATLPSEIGLLPNLRILDLAYTQIGTLPLEIGNIPNLTSLYVNNTPMVASKDWHALRKQLSEKIPLLRIHE